MYGRVLFALNVKVCVCPVGLFEISSFLEVNLRSKGRLHGRSQAAHRTAVPPDPRLCFPWFVAEVSRKQVILLTRRQRVSSSLAPRHVPASLTSLT